MKTTLTIFFLLIFTLGAQAQWKTIYEAGYGTSVSLRYDCKSHFTFSPDPASNQNTVSFNVIDDQNRIGMNAYLSPFNDQCELKAGIYKFIPEMGQYASLRVYLDLTLPDSVGTVYYATIPDSVFDHPTTGLPMWTDFASDIQSSLVYFSNFDGDQTIYIYSEFDVSPGTVSYDYLRVEADTTQMLAVPSLQTDFSVFSSGQELSVQPSQPNADYQLQLFELSGKCVYNAQKTGPQNLPLPFASGIYLVVLSQNGADYQKKIYIE